MEHARQVMAVLALGALAGSTTGCATMFRRGNGLTTIQPAEDGRNVRAIAMNMRGATPELRIFEDARELTIVAVRDNIWSNAVRNSAREAGARASARPGETYRWTETTEFGPGLFLDPGRSHTLRLVRGGQEATITVRASVRPKWIWRDALLGPLSFVGWGVDAITGMWREFPRLDVEEAFRNATAAAAAAGGSAPRNDDEQ